MAASAYSPGLAHVGLSVWNMDLMIDFYSRVFDLQVTDRGPGNTFPFQLAFLSSNPEHHHQVAFAQNRPEGAVSTVMQVSFKVRWLEELREARRRALSCGATKLRGLSHGNALSIYFMDPEENLVEVYLDTPWYVAQPHGDPLDLDKSDAEIWAEVERVVRSDPTFKPVTEWAARFEPSES